MLKKASSNSRISYSARPKKEGTAERVSSAHKDEKRIKGEKDIQAASIRIQSAVQSAKPKLNSSNSFSSNRIQSAMQPSKVNEALTNENNTAGVSKRLKIPQYLKEMNIIDKKQNEKIISNMNKRINYMRNPRYKIIRPPILFSQALTKPELQISPESSGSIFRAVPSSLLFQNYMIHEVYEIDLKIVNVSAVSQRIKFLPPSSQQFTVTKMTYPSDLVHKYDEFKTAGYTEDPQKEKGHIAPGMSLILKVKFYASSFSEFRDEITFISEQNVFKVPIIAQKEAPQISLPEILDCQSCWLGDRADMVFRIQNKGGEAGFKFFSSNEQDDAKQEGDTLHTDCFSLYPSEFYIQKGEVVEIFATFTPKVEGLTQEKIILACDNLSSSTYILQGTGNMAELGIYGLDQMVFSSNNNINSSDDIASADKLQEPTEKQKGLKKIFFENACPGTVVSRILNIENLASVRVRFHWAISTTDTRTSGLNMDSNNNDYCFNISPANGYFEKSEIKQFTISYSAKDPTPIYEYATLIIDDISLDSIRNPPESILRLKQNRLAKSEEQEKFAKEQADALSVDHKPLFQVQKPGFIGSNSDRPSLIYFEFELIGLSTYSNYQISPPFYAFSGALYSGKIYYKEFTLTNNSDSLLHYSITVEKGLCHPFIITEIPQKNGEVLPRKQTVFSLGFSSKAVGNNRSVSFRIEFDKAHSQIVELIGDFIGPRVSASVPTLDFGLIKAGDIGRYRFEIKNESDIEAEVAFLEGNEHPQIMSFECKDLSHFDFTKEVKQFQLILTFLECKAKAMKESSSRNREEEFVIKRDENERFYKKAVERIALDPQYAVIPPKGRQVIEVRCACEDATSIRRIIECKVKDSKSIFLNLLAEIQRIHVSLNRVELKKDVLYASNHYTFAVKKTPDYFEIQNLGNLPCNFEWELSDKASPRRNEMLKYAFTPSKGIVPPKSKLPIKFEIWPLQGGQIDEIFVLNCEGQDFPLGFAFQTTVLGLSVEFEKVQDFISLPLSPRSPLLNTNGPASPLKNNSQIHEGSQINQPFSQGSTTKLSPKRQSRLLQEVPEKKAGPKLETLEYYECLINQPKTIKICIRNTSGVNTTFEIFSEKYKPFQTISDGEIEVSQLVSPENSLLSGEQSLSSGRGVNPSALPITSSNVNGSLDPTQSTKGIRFSINASSQKMPRRESNIRIGKKQLKPLPPKPMVLLSDDIEKQKFSSHQGQMLSQTRQLEKDQRVYLSNNKGIAILCEPAKGVLKGNSEVIVKVTCFNDICGHFKDNLIIEVKGLPQRKFPLVAEIKGSPVVVCPSQLGMNYKGDWPCYFFGTYMRNIPTTKREFKIVNTGPKDIVLDWKLFNLDETQSNEKGEDRQFLNVKITDPHLGSGEICLVNFVPQEPPECTESPFNILEKNIVVSARQEKIIQIEYNSIHDNSYRYVMVGKPRLLNPRDSYVSSMPDVDEVSSEKLETDNQSTPSMGTVAIYLRATSLFPELYFDKLKNVHGAHKITFEKWALAENKKESREICLVNLHESNMIFTVQIAGPFKLLSAVTNSPHRNNNNTMNDTSSTRLLSAHRQPVETKFNLVQNSNLKLKLLFEGGKVSDYEEWPLTYKVYKYGVLNLLYSNGDSQVIELEGRLLRPHIALNTSGTEDVQGTDIQDFGTVHIDNIKTIVVFLSNLQAVPATWKINHLKSTVKRDLSAIPQNTITKLEMEDTVRLDDPTVFEFQITEGHLVGPSAPVKTFPDGLALPGKTISNLLQQQHLYPQKIYINFRPKRNVLYKSKFRVTVQEGPFIDFILRGTGSYAENQFK